MKRREGGREEKRRGSTDKDEKDKMRREVREKKGRREV